MRIFNQKTDYNDLMELRMSAEALDWLEENMPEIKDIILQKFAPHRVGQPGLSKTIGSAILTAMLFQRLEKSE